MLLMLRANIEDSHILSQPTEELIEVHESSVLGLQTIGGTRKNFHVIKWIKVLSILPPKRITAHHGMRLETEISS